MKRTSTIVLSFILLLGIGPKVDAQETRETLPVLLPIAFGMGEQIQGANGTIWKGTTYFYNPGPNSIRLPQTGPSCVFPPCVYEPGSTVLLSPRKVSPDRGSLLDSPLAVYEARVREISRPSQPGGFQVPVVRNDDYLTRETTLVAIPRSDDFRSTLRIYDPSRSPDTQILIEFISYYGDVIASTVLDPGSDPVLQSDEEGAEFLPGFDAIFDIESRFPQLRELEGEDEENLVFHIRMTPLKEDLVFWGFVSVTHNETQHVFLVTPNNLPEPIPR